jgi:hypothetical protein
VSHCCSSIGIYLNVQTIITDLLQIPQSTFWQDSLDAIVLVDIVLPFRTTSLLTPFPPQSFTLEAILSAPCSIFLGETLLSSVLFEYSLNASVLGATPNFSGSVK